jgi:hypothetical protein
MFYGVPEVRVMAEGRELDGLAFVRVVSSRTSPVDRLEAGFVTVAGAPLEGERIAVAMGYRGQAPTVVFGGRVRDVAGAGPVEVTAQDVVRELRDTRVRQAFRNATFAEVVRWSLQRAGVRTVVLGSAETPRRHLFIAANQPVLDVCRAAQRTWGLEDWDLYGAPDGSVYVVPWAESARALEEPVLDLEYGQNVTEFEPRGERQGIVETWLAPWVKHSHRVRLRHESLWPGALVARVDQVEHAWDRQGGRTRVEWSVQTS